MTSVCRQVWSAPQVSVVQALLSPQSSSASQQPGIGSRPQVLPSQVAGLHTELGHGVQRVPQWAGSLSLTQLPPQAWKLAVQATPQVLLVQVASASGGALQRFPHAPQLVGSDRVSVSQPESGLPSQSANPASHASCAQLPRWQVALA
jgi:hypothetical protein